MSVRPSNSKSSRITHTGSTSNKNITNNKLTKKIQRSNVVPPRKLKQQMANNNNNNQKIKVDYNSSNYFYNENDSNNDGERYAEYYDQNQKDQKYNHETSDSYITVEQEDGNIRSVPKYYMEYNNRRNTPLIYKNQNYDDYGENSDGEENEEDEGEEIENDEMYYENEEEYEQDDIVEQHSPNKNYNQYSRTNKYYVSQNNNTSENNKNKKTNQNVISRPIHHQINHTKDIKNKTYTTGSLRNYGNNTTTTNNTYNNNIYYINQNPNHINVKNKNIKDETQKLKKIANKKNSVYKNVDITINKRKSNKEKDFFKSHNIDKSQKIKYINSAIKIQSIFRGYLLRIKVFNNINLYLCCKNGIEILEKLFKKRKKFFWKKYQNYASSVYNAILNSRLSLNILEHYLKNNYRNNSTNKKYVSFHKELGDSFNIINKRENSEKKLKSKLNDVMKENTELKNQLVDNKNIEEKMKNLIDENKKNQNINAIIMKDNQQLAKKLKDFQDYRNTNLIVQNQSSLDLTQKELIEIDELIKKNEIYKNKIKLIYLSKFIMKKTKENKYLMKNIFERFKNTINNIKNEEKERNIKRQVYLMNFVNIINNNIKLTKSNIFQKLFYVSIIMKEVISSRNNIKNEILKNIFIKKDQERKDLLLKSFIKIYYNNISQINKTDKEEKSKEDIKLELLKKIFNNYNKNRGCILKIFTEKWILKSKILGMRAAARDKKKKRKLKKKNNKLISQNNLDIVNKNQEKKINMNNKFCKSIHEFSYIVSNGTIIKESSSNEQTEINVKNNKCSISSDKINKSKKFNKNVGLKKINSVNEINIQSNIKKENKDNNKEKTNSNLEESDEDSGDSLGLGNNSD